MTVYNVIALCAIGIMLTAGDFSMKEWVVRSHGDLHIGSFWYIAAIILYVAALSWAGYLLKYIDFAVSTISILLFNTIAVVIAGYTFFGDTLSWYEVAGIATALCSITLFSLSNS